MNKQPLIGVVGLSGQSAFMKVNHFHLPGETLAARSMQMEPGGKGFNQAVAARRLGARVRFLTALGQDEFGRQCRQRLQQEGVESKIIWSQQPTAFASILTDAGGENRVTVYPGASEELQAEYVTAYERWFAQCDALLVQLEYGWQSAEAALQIARRYGIPIVLNPAPAISLPMEQLLKFDAVIPNRQEAAVLLGEAAENRDSHELAARLFHAGLTRAVITLGADGALEMSEGGAWQWACPPARVVDTTGAGDTFCAAFTVRLAEGATRSEAVEFALNAASKSVEHARVLEGLPYRREMPARQEGARTRIELHKQ